MGSTYLSASNRTGGSQAVVNVSVLENVTSVTGAYHAYSLEEINDKVAHIYLAPIIFVGILMVIGVVGNGLVLYIYSLKFKSSSHRVFIIVLSFVDLVTCSIGMPFVIVDFRYSLIFYFVSICKTLRFVNYFMSLSSAFILIAIAVDRYRKICLPWRKQMSLYLVRISCCISLVLGFAVSWPAPVLFGYNTVQIGYGNLTGASCQTDDKYKNKPYQAYFNITLLFILFGVFLSLTTLYSLIGRQIYYQGRNARGRMKRNSSQAALNLQQIQTAGNENNSIEKDRKDSSINKQYCTEKETGLTITINSTSLSRTNDSSTSNTGCKKKRIRHRTTRQYSRNIDSLEKCAQRKYRRLFRTTFMMFVISVVFFISYFPHIFLHVATFVNQDFVLSMSNAEYATYVVFLYSFFINNVANPFIYGMFDSKFRKEIMYLWMRASEKSPIKLSMKDNDYN
ncbi:hypothetical protein ACJMK2_003981 [Sinanodonta woodiana]|uniref:G-protein coupled receptors family 1 profile domain-containing protein n=1 Tax=Sinanodonta woodiana TaxID=1069815 RepID=A0ABD3Y0F8_SINWO